MGFNKPNMQHYGAISLSVDGLLTSDVKFMQMTSLRAIKAVSSLVTLIIVPLFVAEPRGRRVLVVGKHRCGRSLLRVDPCTVKTFRQRRLNGTRIYCTFFLFFFSSYNGMRNCMFLPPGCNEFGRRFTDG